MDRLSTTVVDELEFGFGWVSPEKPNLRLTSHALLADGRVWVLDPSDAPDLDQRLRALGEPAGVIQLLDRHNRASALIASRLGVELHRVPFGGVEGSPFEVVPVVRRRRWQEIALWWPERAVLVCADALGTVPHYFALGGERIGVHPLLRLTPPRELARFEPAHVLVGHGEGVHNGAAAAVDDAVTNARRRLLRLPIELPAAFRRTEPATR